VGPIRIIRGAEAPDVSPSGGSGPAEVEAALPLPPPAVPRQRLPASAIVLLLIVAAAVGLLAYSSRAAGTRTSADSSVMLAVLPLKNLGVAGAEDYLSDGITEELTTELGRTAPGALAVIARSSARPYRDSAKTVREIGRELRVDYVLEGTVRRQEHRVRVATQLIRTSDEAQVWAEVYERRLDDVLALQEQIARAVATAVEVQLARRPARTAEPLGLREREQYLRGRFHLGSRDPDGKAKALEYFEGVVAAQPRSALGHLGVAESYMLMANNTRPPREAMPAATEAVHRALQLEPDLAAAHMVRATIALQYDWDWPGAERSVQRALALDPNLAAANALLATILSSAGRFEEAIAPAERAYTLDPISPWTTISAPWQNLAARRWEAALAEGERQLELSPGNADFLATMSLAYQRLGRTADAVEAARASYAQTPNAVGNAALAGLVLAEAGQIDEAQRIAEHLDAMRQRDYVCAYNVAGVYAALGQTDRAFELLEQGFRDRSG
jgi:TolB-like protein